MQRPKAELFRGTSEWWGPPLLKRPCSLERPWAGSVQKRWQAFFQRQAVHHRSGVPCRTLSGTSSITRGFLGGTHRYMGCYRGWASCLVPTLASTRTYLGLALGLAGRAGTQADRGGLWLQAVWCQAALRGRHRCYGLVLLGSRP